MKKFLAILLTLVMVMGLMAGCGSKSNDAQTNTNSKDEIVTLKWISVGNGKPANYDAWKANLDKYLEEKIGVHLDYEIIGWGDWDTRRNMIVSTNEPYDIMFTNNGTFYNDVSTGAFADITEVLEKAPELKKFIPDSYWEACKIDGKLYGVPTYKDSSATFFFVLDKALADATGLDYTSVHTLQDLVPVLEAMKEIETAEHHKGEAPFIIHKGGVDAIYGGKYDDISAGVPAIGVSYKNGKPEVVSVFEQEDVLKDIDTLHEMFTKGLINSNAAILEETPSYTSCMIAQGWPMAAKTVWGPNLGVEAIAIQWGDTVLSNATVQGSMNCISASSKHPDKALQLLELVNTDSYVRDALFYGLEGDNFDYTADHKVHKNNTDWPGAGYTQGTFFNVTTLDTDEANQWDEVKVLNEQATPSPILGFSFNTEPVADELSACHAIFEEWRAQIMTGTADPAKAIESMLSAMRDSGFDDIIKEAQSQIDTWVANK